MGAHERFQDKRKKFFRFAPEHKKPRQCGASAPVFQRGLRDGLEKWMVFSDCTVQPEQPEQL